MLTTTVKSNTRTSLLLALGLSVIMCSPAHASSKTTIKPNKLKDSALLIDIVPTLCRMNTSYSRLRQCKEGRPYAINRLKFINIHNCKAKKSRIKLSPVQAKVLGNLMPDQKSQQSAWNRYGSCSGLSTSRYFRKIIQQAGKLRLINEIKDGKSYTISQAHLRKKLISANAGLIRDSVRFFCHTDKKSKKQMLTHIKVCYKNNQYYPCQAEKTYKNRRALCKRPMLSIIKP